MLNQQEPTGKATADIESERISLFFRKPAQGDPPDKRRSNLYILRRDLSDLMSDEGTATDIGLTAPMLAAIGMLSGIDLMAWTTTWPNEPGRNSFEEFLRKYGGLKSDEAEALYQYRCAQVHSYGLFAIRKRKQQPQRTAFAFTLDPAPTATSVIAHCPAPNLQHHYTVFLYPLRGLFLAIAENFENAVRNEQATRNTFLSAIEKIGFFTIKTGWVV